MNDQLEGEREIKNKTGDIIVRYGSRQFGQMDCIQYCETPSTYPPPPPSLLNPALSFVGSIYNTTIRSRRRLYGNEMNCLRVISFFFFVKSETGKGNGKCINNERQRAGNEAAPCTHIIRVKSHSFVVVFFFYSLLLFYYPWIDERISPVSPVQCIQF